MEAEMNTVKGLFTNARKPVSTTKVCVIVPVRNEAKDLAKTLEALCNQVDGNGIRLDPKSYEVLVLVNNSTDNSFQIARNYARKFPDFRLCVENIFLSEEQAHIGTVRRLLMDEAYNRMLCANNPDGIIASTDGDTIVDSQWIFHIMAEIADGNDAVGGRILTEKMGGSARLFHLRDVTYRCLLTQAESLIDPQIHNPFPCHFQYFGANMAVTCKMYEQAGRLPKLPFLEDLAFHKALMLQDARIRKSFKVKVYTSTRINGRVMIGFSEQLKKWKEEEEANKTQMVEEVAPLLQMFGIRNRLRKCWCDFTKKQFIIQNEIDEMASILRVNAEWLLDKIITANYFGSLWDSVNQKINSEIQKDRGLQPIDQAIIELREFIKKPHTIVFQTNQADTFSHAG